MHREIVGPSHGTRRAGLALYRKTRKTQADYANRNNFNGPGFHEEAEIKGRNGETRSVVVQTKAVPTMSDARRKMIEGLRGESRVQTDYQARCSAQEALHGARRQLANFGPVDRYRDAVESKNFPTPAQRASAVRIANAAEAVKVRTLELEAVLKDESAAVLRIERAQAELVNAQKTLASALSSQQADATTREQTMDARIDRAITRAMFKAGRL